MYFREYGATDTQVFVRFSSTVLADKLSRITIIAAGGSAMREDPSGAERVK